MLSSPISDVVQISPINFSRSGQILNWVEKYELSFPCSFQPISHNLLPPSSSGWSTTPPTTRSSSSLSSSPCSSSSLLCDLSPSVHWLLFEDAAKVLHKCRTQWSKLWSRVIEVAFEDLGQSALIFTFTILPGGLKGWYRDTLPLNCHWNWIFVNAFIKIDKYALNDSFELQGTAAVHASPGN